MKIPIADFEQTLQDILISTGLEQEAAAKVANVYIRASFRNVGHHDFQDLLGRIKQLREKRVNAVPHYTQIAGFGGIACYDGDNGLGELNAYFAAEKSMELAEAHGIGLCTIRNSNHFLSAAPYVEIAEERGFLTIIMSKSPDGLSLPGADKSVIGNNPFGFAAGYQEGKLLLDICCAYASVGKTKQMAELGETVPEYWGNNAQGQPTSKPAEILDSGLYMPIGEHKGFGIAVLVELLTAVLGQGAILTQGLTETGFPGICTQTAITIAVGKIMDFENYTGRVQHMVDILRERYPGVYIPGQRSVIEKEKIQKEGYFEIPDDLFQGV